MLCKANSCPLDVEFITTWETIDKKRLPKWGVCRYHRVTDPDDWQEITGRVIQYQDRINGLRGRQGETDPLFQARPGELVGDYFDRYESNLRDLICGRIGKVDAATNFAHIINLLGG